MRYANVTGVFQLPPEPCHSR